MKRTLAFALILLVIAAALVYAGDYAVLRYRIATGKQPFESVTVYRYYSIAEKNRRTEYVFNQAAAQTCARSLFSHLGYSPCWYLKRHTEQRIEM